MAEGVFVRERRVEQRQPEARDATNRALDIGGAACRQDQRVQEGGARGSRFRRLSADAPSGHG